MIGSAMALNRYSRIAILVGIATAILGTPPLVHAQATNLAGDPVVQICVRCASPDASYVCEVVVPGGTQSRPPLQLFCAQEIARLHAHGQCGTTRASAGTCPGEVVPLVYTGPVHVPPFGPDGTPRGSMSDAPPAAPPVEQTDGAKGPPRTMVEATKRAAETTKDNVQSAGETIGGWGKQTGEFIEDTGEAVGTAAKKSWDCLVSLFGKC